MKRFEVIISKRAGKDLSDLPLKVAINLLKYIRDILTKTPLPLGKKKIKKLRNYHPPLYRLRIGDYRSYYRIEGQKVIVLRIVSKKDSEKILRSLR